MRKMAIRLNQSWPGCSKGDGRRDRQHLADGPGLATELGHEPARLDGNPGQRYAPEQRLEQSGRKTSRPRHSCRKAAAKSASNTTPMPTISLEAPRTAAPPGEWSHRQPWRWPPRPPCQSLWHGGQQQAIAGSARWRSKVALASALLPSERRVSRASYASMPLRMRFSCCAFRSGGPSPAHPGNGVAMIPIR